MRINFQTIARLTLLEIANLNFALGCKDYGLGVSKAIDVYAEMFQTGDIYEIHHFLGVNRSIKKYVFYPYVLGSYLSDQGAIKAHLHRRFKNIYNLTEDRFQTDRSSQSDTALVINGIYSFKKDRELIRDKERARQIAEDAMKWAYHELGEMLRSEQ